MLKQQDEPIFGLEQVQAGTALMEKTNNIAAWATEYLAGEAPAPPPSPEVLQVARNMQAAGMPAEQIQQLTGLTPEQLANL